MEMTFSFIRCRTASLFIYQPDEEEFPERTPRKQGQIDPKA
jgi:hypothetical protein